MSVETIITVVAIMGYVIGRQLAGEPLRVKRVIGLPIALTVIGIVEVVTSKGRGSTLADVILIVAGLVINAVIGIGQGRLMRLESRYGFLWGQMPASVLWWWVAKIASGVVLDGIGHAIGAQLATTSAFMLLGLGVNRLGQAAIVAPRGLATGIPFAPEPDRPGADLKGQVLSEQANRIVAEIRDRASRVFDDVRPDLHPSRPALGQRCTSPNEKDPTGVPTEPPGADDGLPATALEAMATWAGRTWVSVEDARQRLDPLRWTSR